jgi:hypothetical protein
MADPDEQLAAMIARYEPAVAALGTAAIVRLRVDLPGAFALVYDNHNALAVGFSRGERLSDGIFPIALHPRAGGACARLREATPARA